MRGKRKSTIAMRPPVRITPAHAGKTQTRACALSRVQDHPRACGENCHIAQSQAYTQGSPPRMRGKLEQERPGTRTIWEDNFRGFNYRLGSPPRMRGKLLFVSRYSDIPRITPAHAGKTLSVNLEKERKKDHPRACGENRQHNNGICEYEGSPPRMRGKQ